MRRGDVADGLMVVGWLLLAAALFALWGWTGLLGYAGGTCLCLGLAMAWKEGGGR